MKKISSILSHLTHRPQFKFLQKHKCYRQFIELLQPRFKRAIAFVYIENSTLFVALSHPGYKMELNYNRDLLKSLLNMMGNHNPECSELNVSNVIVFNSKFHKSSPKPKIATDPKYYELSTGEFRVDSTDSKIIEKFESIKRTIMENIE